MPAPSVSLSDSTPTNATSTRCGVPSDLFQVDNPSYRMHHSVSPMRWMSRPTYEQNTHFQSRRPVHTTNAGVGTPSDEMAVQSIGDKRGHSFYLLGYASNPCLTKDVNLLAEHYRTQPYLYSTVPLFSSSLGLVVGLVWVTIV